MTQTKSRRKKAAEVPLLDDGQIHFRIKSGETVQDHALDLFLSMMAIERCIEKHKLSIVDGLWIATDPFLADLATELTKSSGITLTPTLAGKLWPIVVSRFSEQATP